jgi:hypothetical protein
MMLVIQKTSQTLKIMVHHNPSWAKNHRPEKVFSKFKLAYA